MLQDCFVADEDGVTCLSWNQSTFDTPTMAVGCVSKSVILFAMDVRTKKWEVRVWLSKVLDYPGLQPSPCTIAVYVSD